MNSDTVWISQGWRDPALVEALAGATGRMVERGEPSDPEAMTTTYQELITRMQRELDPGVEDTPEELKRRPGENRRQHRARLRELRRRK